MSEDRMPGSYDPKATPKFAPANIYHRNKNVVRMTPRKAFGSGPVVKKQPFGRCRPNWPELMTNKVRGHRGKIWRYT